MGSGAAGAAGLYGRGASWAESLFCSAGGLTEDMCWGNATGLPMGGGGGRPMGAGLTTADSDWEFRVCPFW